MRWESKDFSTEKSRSYFLFFPLKKVDSIKINDIMDVISKPKVMKERVLFFNLYREFPFAERE